jgi:hypothetical protein
MNKTPGNEVSAFPHPVAIMEKAKNTYISACQSDADLISFIFPHFQGQLMQWIYCHQDITSPHFHFRSPFREVFDIWVSTLAMDPKHNIP